MVVTPAHDKRRRKRLQDVLTAYNEQYGKALKRLAECDRGADVPYG